jgi:hypothetical protein
MSWPAQSKQVSCEGSLITVTASSAVDAQLTCEAAALAKDLFVGCSVPSITRPVHVELIDELTSRCFGQYHCGEDRIKLLEPSVMAESRLPDSIFAYLSSNEFFRSVAVHELAHAAIENMPCPFEACVVGAEYVAYVMQILSLSPSAQRLFTEQADPGRLISREELNSTIYLMAPDVFAKKAWMHFTQRDDPCSFIGQIVNGTVVLDRKRSE